MRRQIIFLSTLATLLFAVSVQAAGWGNLKVRFVFDGKAPKPQKEVINKDPQFCGKFNIVDEELVVAKDGGLANVLVFIRDAKLPIHPDYAKSAKDVVKVDNRGCRFEPRITLLRTTQTLMMKNSDQVAHNVKIEGFFANSGINPLVPAGLSVNQQFPLPETNAATVACAIHPWMEGWLIVRPNPYMAASDKEGNLEIKNIPEGTWEFQFWHERAGYLGYKKAVVKVNGKTTKWKRGRPKLEIKAGATNDLGVVKIPAKAFAKK